MKKMTTDIQYGSHEKGNYWELKGVEYELPETLAELVEFAGDEERAVRAHNTLYTIRYQDRGRALHAGSKNRPGVKDAQVREALKPFRLFAKTYVAATPRAMTAAELKSHLLTMEPEARAAYIAELMAE